MTRRDWIGALVALAAGLAAGLAHPPFGLLPGLLGYGVLLWRLEVAGRRPLRGAFLTAWLAGLGYFGVSTYWIAEPFLVDVAVHGWMAPFAVVLMGGGLALFWGAAGAAYRALGPQGAWKAPVFAGVFSAAEWLRGHVLTGFPWNLPGESWQAGTAPSQAAAWLGAYGLTWLTLAIAAAPAVLWTPASRRTRAVVLLASGVALAGLYGAGAARLGRPDLAGEARTPLLRVVQANIDQKEKWRPDNLGMVFDAYAELTLRPAARRPDVVIWPEGALPAVIDELLAPGSPYAARLRDLMRPGQTLLMGANRVEPTPDGGYRYFNTLVAFRRDAAELRVVGHYDKHRLVPFGEFIPLGELAGRLGVRSLVHMPDDFTAGPPPRPLRLPGLPSVQPLICYEALFPEPAVTGARPAWILNVSNDAWFGRTSGPLQHLNIASYRAIEQGLPIVRATPTGVSAVIDAKGRLLPGQRLGLGAFGVIDAALPPPAPATPYSRIGDWGFAGLLGFSGVAALAGRRPRRALGAT